MSTKRLSIAALALLAALSASPLVTRISADTTCDPSKGYCLLEPLPVDNSGNTKDQVDPGEYLSNIFKLVISLALVFAVFRLIYAGIIYITTAVSSQKTNAKEIIQETFLGLGLTLGAWLIVATILQPAGGVLDISLSLTPIEIPPDTNTGGGGGGGRILPGYKLSPAQVAQDTAIRDSLKPVTVNNGPCTDGGTTDCTNVVGLPSSAINGVKRLASDCGCSIEITGGTEGGHTNHGPGLAAVDLSPTNALNAYLAKTNPAAANPINNTKVSVGGGRYTFEVKGANGRATGDHWHVQY